MNEVNKKQLEELLVLGKWDEAGKMIVAYLEAEDDGTDAQAQIKSAMALVYLDVMVKINEAYEASLKEAIAQIRDLKTMAREAKENAGKRRVEASIGKLQV